MDCNNAFVGLRARAKNQKENVALLLVGPKAKAKLSMKITLPIPMGSNLVRTKFLNHFVKFKSEPPPSPTSKAKE